MKLACQENLVPGKTLEERLENLEKYGFEGIEFWGRGIEERVEEIKSALGKSKIKVSSLCAGYRGCFLDPQKTERDLATSDMKEILSIAADLGAVGVIMVPIFGPPRLPDLSPLYNPIQLEREMIVRILQELGQHAQEVGTLVLVEPLNRYETHFINRLEQAIQICQQVDSPNVKIMADFFHMHIEEANIPESIKKAKDWIYHVHLADSNRMLPGLGHTDFASGLAALKEIGYDKYMAMECGVPGDPEVELPKSVKYLKQFM